MVQMQRVHGPALNSEQLDDALNEVQELQRSGSSVNPLALVDPLSAEIRRNENLRRMCIPKDADNESLRREIEM